MQNRYYRISPGEAYDIIVAWEAEKNAGFSKVNEIAVRYGGVMDKHIMFGTRVEGIKFTTSPDPKLWKPIAKVPGFYRPNKQTKAGKLLFQALDAIRYPSGQDLAVRLGCPPFFSQMGNHYCTDIGFKKVGDDYYAETPFFAPMKELTGAVLIPRADYFLAIDGPI